MSKIFSLSEDQLRQLVKKAVKNNLSEKPGLSEAMADVFGAGSGKPGTKTTLTGKGAAGGKMGVAATSGMGGVKHRRMRTPDGSNLRRRTVDQLHQAMNMAKISDQVLNSVIKRMRSDNASVLAQLRDEAREEEHAALGKHDNVYTDLWADVACMAHARAVKALGKSQGDLEDCSSYWLPDWDEEPTNGKTGPGPGPGKTEPEGKTDGGLKAIEGTAEEFEQALLKQLRLNVQSFPASWRQLSKNDKGKKLAHKQSNVYQQIINAIKPILKDAGYVMSEATVLDLEDKIRNKLFKVLRQNFNTGIQKDKVYQKKQNKELNNVTAVTLVILKKLLKTKGLVIAEAATSQEDLIQKILTLAENIMQGLIDHSSHPKLIKESNSYSFTNETDQDQSVVEKLAGNLYPYLKKQLKFDRDASIRLVSDPENGSNPLGKTAYYDPASYSVTIYADNRHPKDILRSFSHEMVHHSQNCQGNFDNTMVGEQGYAQNDSHLREMERQAYEVGNLAFRDWEDGMKTAMMERIRAKLAEKSQIVDQPKLKLALKEAITKDSLTNALFTG